MHTMTVTHVKTGKFVEGRGYSTQQLRIDLINQLNEKINE